MNRRMAKKSDRERRIKERMEYNSMKAYCREGEFAFATFGSVVFVFLRLYMLYIEVLDGGSILLMAEALVCIVFAASMVLCTLFSRLERMPNFFTALMLLGIMLSSALFCALDVMELVGERDILGIIQTASMVLYCGTCALNAASLLWAGADKKVNPMIGTPASVACVAAMAFLTVRGLTVFSALLSAVGQGFSWDAASDLTAQLSWALRSVSRGGGYAVSMFYARMFERVGLLFAIFSTMPLLFRFKPFFEKGNRELEFKKEFEPIRAARIAKAVEVDDDFEYMPKITSNRHTGSDIDEQYGEISFENDATEQESLFGENEEKPIPRPEARSIPRPEPIPEQPVEHGRPNAIESEIPMSDEGKIAFSKPESVIFDKTPSKNGKPAQKRKDKPNYSDPEDPDFWNHYLD